MGEIKLDAHNYRIHDDKNLKLIKRSLKKLGAGRSILIDADGVIIAGNATYQTAQELGIPVETIKIDGSKVVALQRTDLHTQDKERKEMALMDNTTSANPNYDYGEIQTDFSTDELPELGIEDIPTLAEENAEIVETEVPEQVETRCKRGDIWQLGEHRLMCGDSTNAADIEKLMCGNKADIAFYSPPYNAGFGKNITKDNGRSKYTNGSDDNMSVDDYRDFLNSVIDNGTNFAQYNFCNIQMLANNKKALIGALYTHIDTLADIMIWDKKHSQPQLAENVMNSQFEFILIFSEKGNRNIGTKKFHGTLPNIISITPKKNEYASEHNAVFSVEFASYFVQNFSTKSVLDLFGGTGTTLIACEQLNRKCYMCEIDPHYCDIILTRWETLTGKQAQRIE